MLIIGWFLCRARITAIAETPTMRSALVVAPSPPSFAPFLIIILVAVVAIVAMLILIRVMRASRP